MRDLREGLTEVDSVALSRGIYERAYKFYRKQMTLRVVYILGIAILGLTGIVERAVTGSTVANVLTIVCYILLFLQAITLPNGTVKDRLGNCFDLKSGVFTPNDG